MSGLSFLPWYVPLLFFCAAILYSSVGHGGASAYIAILVFLGFSHSDIAPLALLFNLIVTTGGWYYFWSEGHFSWPLLYPFVLTSVPAAFVGGMVPLSSQIFSAVLFIALFCAGLRFLFLTRPLKPSVSLTRTQITFVGLSLGLLLGFLAGLVGVGGGIFLSPLILLLGWADAKQTAAVSAGFIVVNSLSGLIARWLSGSPDFSLLVPLGLAVFLGGQIGSKVGARRLPSKSIQRILGMVLLIASFKLLPDVFR